MEEEYRTSYEYQDPENRKWLWWAIPGVVVIALAAVLYYGWKHKQEPAAVVEQVKTQPVAPAAETPLHNPIEPPANADATPLPELGASDAELQNSLAEIFGRSLQDYLVPKDVIRHVVATVDNLPRKKTAMQLWPLKPTAGSFTVSGAEEALTLNEENFSRYQPLLKILKNTDTDTVAALYKRFYPLFQQAYVELGYPDGYFNDRLIAVIDHLLATPEVAGPIQLTQPGVFYQFADPALEEKSAGQKLLIRMGSDNAAAVKIKLRELRREIAKRPE